MDPIPVAPDMLEALVRGYHTPTNAYSHCNCGWINDAPTTPSGTRKHAYTSHVAFEIREALAGRLRA